MAYVPPSGPVRPLNPSLSPGDRVRRVRRMVHRRHNDITLQNNAVSVPRFIGTLIHATNVQRHLLPRNRQYNNPYIPHVHTF